MSRAIDQPRGVQSATADDTGRVTALELGGGESDTPSRLALMAPRLWHMLQLGLVLVVTLVAWEMIVELRNIKPFVLPPPSMIWESLVAQAQTEQYWTDVYTTTREALLGFMFGVGSAITLGVLVTEFRFVEKIMLPYVVALQTVPKVTIAPLLLIWFGFGMTSKVLMAAIICFFPMLKNTIAGLAGTDPQMLEMMRAIGASRVQVLFRCKMKSALPILFAGLEISVVFAILGAIVSEFTGATAGLGYRILSFNFTFNVAGMFAIMVTLALMGMVAHGLLAMIRRRVVFWDHKDLNPAP